MRSFQDGELDDLVSCPKRVHEPPKREMRIDGRMRRNDMSLKSLDDRHLFRVFLRQSTEFPENFSIGLVYLPGSDPGSFALIRYNGQHGGERAHPHHAVFHVHKARAEDVNAGILEPRLIERATDYASFRQALARFCSVIQMQDVEAHFRGLTQASLLTGDEL